MPKRGRGRGRGRPQSGGRKHKGRGGYLGGKNSFIKRGRGGSSKGHSRPGGNGSTGEFPELYDLDNPDFISVSHPERTMKAAASRTRRLRSRLQDEVFTTEDNIENTMKLPLRKRPVEFVKSTTYDPSKDLIRKLREGQDYLKKIESNNKESHINETQIVEPFERIEEAEGKDSYDTVVDCDEIDPDDFEEDIEELKEDLEEVEEDIEELSEIQIENISNTVSEDFEMDDVDYLNKKDTVKELDTKIKDLSTQETSNLQSLKKDMIREIPDDQLFFVDNEGTEIENVKVVESIPLDIKASNAWVGKNTEFTPTITIGHIQLTTKQGEDGNQEVCLPPIGKPLKNLTTFVNTIENNKSLHQLSDSDDDLYITNNSNSNDLHQKYAVYINNVLKNVLESDSDEDEDEDYENEEQISDSEDEARFIANIDDDDSEADDIDLIDSNNTVDDLEKLRLDEKSAEPEEPEYGFDPEDYESFDTSLVDVINVRYGSTSNQYHMKSFRLTGSYDFEWIDQELFTDFLLENGMPTRRLNAYYKFIQDQLTPPEVEEKDYDINFSDSESEDEYDERQEPLSESDDDNEGLDDLIKYTTKYDGLRDQYVPETKSIKTKGKKKELVLDNITDQDLKDALNEQYRIRRESKKQKKKDRESNVQKEHASSKDLSLKYPYSFHVKDIKSEFEDFFLDVKRNALTFPPMDPHAIKTIGKFAYYYNMKSRKFGSGLKQHAVVIKNKRTFRSVPDYHSVGQLMKQRRVFDRIDQKRAKTQIEQEEAKSSRRGKPSKAHVQEGDIVGANAPEISNNNIGRKLLMKMGWTVGQGLGANNAGIPEPVIAKVKKTKLGIR